VRAGRATAVAVIGVGLIALGAPVGAVTSNQRAAGRHYLALVEPVAAAEATLRAGGGWTTITCTASGFVTAGTDTPTSIPAVCYSPQEQPVIAALQHWRAGLDRFVWPRSDRGDVRELVRSVVLEISQWNRINQPNAASWRATLDRDENGITEAANLVRHDFGLPPSSSQ
jgi:hypothetical protein